MIKLFKNLLIGSMLFACQWSFAGHLFTQGSTNTPTWIASGTGIAIDQYHLETGNSFLVYTSGSAPTPQPAGVVVGANPNSWWQWSAGDVIQLNFGTISGGVVSTSTFTVAYDANASCTYSACGVPDLSVNNITLSNQASLLTLNLPSGTLSSSNSYTWSIVALAGEFAVEGFRVGFANGKVHGSQTGPLNQSSVVSAASLPAPAPTPAPTPAEPPAPPPIDTAKTAYSTAELNANQVTPKFVGGTLAVGGGGTVATAFTVNNQGGSINIGAADTKFSGAITDEYANLASGSLKKIGSGVLTVTGVNTFSGGFEVNEGKLAVSTDASLGASTAALVLNGGTLLVTDNLITSRQITVASGNGALEVDPSKAVVANGVVSGAGALAKKGAGNLTLTGANTFTGGVAVEAGKLIISADSNLGAAPGAVTLNGGVLQVTETVANSRSIALGSANGVIEIDAGKSLTAAGTTSGVGGLIKAGAGTLTLSGNNSFSGGVAIESGKLAISNDANLGASSGLIAFNGGVLKVSGEVANSRPIVVSPSNGVIEIDAGKTMTAAGTASGAGGLIKSGAGTLTLAGANTFAGGVDLKEGRLVISNDANLGASTGGFGLTGGVLQVTDNVTTSRPMAFIGNTTVEVDAGKAYAVASDILGNGGLSKAGDGTIVLTGASVYSGTTSIASGELKLNGVLTQSNVQVAKAGVISGSGAVGGSLLLDGVVKPGNSPGTLSVVGDFTMTPSSKYVVEIDGSTHSLAGGAGSYDRIVVTGSSSVFTASGAIEPVLRGISGSATNSYSPQIGSRFRIVSTMNPMGVTGKFDTLVNPTSGMLDNTRFEALYGGNYIDLALTPASYAVFARQYGLQNMVNAAAGLDSIRPAFGANSDSNLDTFFRGLYPMSSPELARTLLQTSGQIYAISLGAERAGTISQFGRLSAVAGNRTNSGNDMWIEASGYNSRTGQDAFASATTGEGGQVWLGMDLMHQNGVVYGLAAGQLKSRVADVSSKADANNDMLAAYLIGRRGELDYDMALGVNRGNSEVSRSVNLWDRVETNRGLTKSNGMTFQIGMGYTESIMPGLDVRTYARLVSANTSAKGFKETGSALTGLSSIDQTYKTAQTLLGSDLIGKITLEGYGDLNLKFGLGATILPKAQDTFIDRGLFMQGARWTVSEASYKNVVPFVNFAVSQKLTEDATLWLQWNQSRVGQTFKRNSGFIGLNYKL